MSSATDDEVGSQWDDGSDRAPSSRSAVRADEDGHVAVVGSGVAGTGVAYALRETPIEVTVFERESTVGGRATTARHEGVVYDYGANYVKPGAERVRTLIQALDEGDLIDVTEPVWTFDANGTVEPGDEDRADDHKWTFENGVSTLPKRLLDRSGATVRTETPIRSVTRIRQDGRDRWYLRKDGGRVGPYDAVVLTPPGSETAAILEAEANEATRGDDTGRIDERTGEDANTIDEPIDEDVRTIDERVATVAATARSVSFRPIRSVVCHYPFPIERPYYALVNVDRDHPIGWLSREEAKRGHVPSGETVLVVQLSPARTRETNEWSDETVADDTASMVATLLGDERLAEPDWRAVHRFQRALPNAMDDTGVQTATNDDDAEETTNDAVPGGTADVRAAESLGLYVAGDWVAGEGRIHAALSSGLEVGDRLRTAIRRSSR